ncbi:hypothetical protein C0Q70_13433 [Pomacea canaliculata]|uniref:Uncharacterized protein n=1 Tax=Pomacea canaliculata TaxID=400727 RepID=A0A2T7NX74_POMCA|nr:hypothetical protein C0Q70_13433 [Pomacea canaliculata]
MFLKFSVFVAAVALSSAGELPNCSPGGSYFDEFTNRLECCADICQDPHDNTAGTYCKSKCPGYDAAIARSVEKTKNGDADSKAKESGPVQHDEERNEGKSDDGPRDISNIVGIVVSGILLVAAVTTMGVVIRWRRQQRSQPQGSSNQYAQVSNREGEQVSIKPPPPSPPPPLPTVIL